MQGAAQASDSPTRARVLAAAEERFAAFGYRRTGIAEIARDAGVAPGTLYRYFENKEEILRSGMREGPGRGLPRGRAACFFSPGGARLSTKIHSPCQGVPPLYGTMFMRGLGPRGGKGGAARARGSPTPPPLPRRQRCRRVLAR